jgi:hypothetical protein
MGNPFKVPAMPKKWTGNPEIMAIQLKETL